MIKSVHLTSLAKSKQDFDLLIKLLEALGLGKSLLQGSKHATLAHFDSSNLQLDLLYATSVDHQSALTLSVDDVNTALELVRRMKLVVTQGDSDSASADHSFIVRLPGGTDIRFVPALSSNSKHADIVGKLSAAGKTFGIV